MYPCNFLCPCLCFFTFLYPCTFLCSLHLLEPLYPCISAPSCSYILVSSCALAPYYAVTFTYMLMPLHLIVLLYSIAPYVFFYPCTPLVPSCAPCILKPLHLFCALAPSSTLLPLCPVESLHLSFPLVSRILACSYYLVPSWRERVINKVLVPHHVQNIQTTSIIACRIKVSLPLLSVTSKGKSRRAQVQERV